VSESDDAATDGGDADERRAYTVRLELADEPGALLGALEPIAECGGNLLSVFHERGALTPRGHIPVEVDVECTPRQFERIVAAMRDAGVNVVQAGSDAYGAELTVLLAGPLVETDLSDTLERLESVASASVVDFSLTDEPGVDSLSSARLRLATTEGGAADALERVRDVAAEKELQVVEPLVEGEA